jgi:acetyl-CoA carboxylase alpha subunit
MVNIPDDLPDTAAYGVQTARIGREMQPRDWNEGATDIADYADAMRDELLAKIRRLRWEHSDLIRQLVEERCTADGQRQFTEADVIVADLARRYAEEE